MIAGTPADDAVPVRLAATVMLLRDEPDDGLQVFVLQRVPGMAFAPGMTVFPGGAVDPSDYTGEPAWLGAGADWWAAELGTEPILACALVVAAARELFEESGVLLSRPAVTADIDPDLLDELRESVSVHAIGLGSVLSRLGLALDADLLRPWANWVTPPGSAHRFDTFFFVAALPAGATARLLTTEAELGRWARPATLLAEHESGHLGLLPPTLVSLSELAGFDQVDQVLAAPRVLSPVRPEVRGRENGGLRIWAAGREYVIGSARQQVPRPGGPR